MRMMGGPGSKDPGLFLAQNWPLSSLVNSAYNLVGYQVSVPGWMHTARFEIRAKAPEETARDQFRVMLQHLMRLSGVMIPTQSAPEIDRAEINRANAQHSIGPKTPEGKQRSSLNALRHGLTGQIIVLPG